MTRTSRTSRIALAIAIAFALGALAALGLRWARQAWWRAQVLDSGGVLSAAQAAYDVRRYQLALTLDPDRRAIAGSNLVTVIARAQLERFVLDLHHRITVSAVSVDGRPAAFEQDDGRLEIVLATNWSSGERHGVHIAFAGKPKISAQPPWFDGFVWEETETGAPWIGVTVQSDGADDFWPVKDHPSDEPEEGVGIELTVPAGLVGLSNGRLLGEQVHDDGSTTSRWEVSAPINNYLVTVNAAPYVPVVERYRGADGTLDLPMTYWALPEHLPAARALWRQAPRALAIFARYFGEFPFLADKIAAVEAPFDGMEHQTLLALAAVEGADESGIYETLVHELAHEWWGNKVSARDWDDFWLHEGFATYAEVLYVEARFGATRARRYLERLRLEIDHEQPLVAGRARTAAEAYSHDIYVKGAWVLASLRWQIGDAAFLRVLRRFAGEPGVCRLVDSAELEALVAAECACDLGPFWRRYLRQSEPPRYRLRRQARADGDEILLSWDDPELAIDFPLRVNGRLERLATISGAARLRVPRGARVEVDTAGRLLAEPATGDGDERSDSGPFGGQL